MVIFPPVETGWVKSDEDLQRLVDQVQEMIMKEIGVEKLTPRRGAESVPPA